MIIDTHCHLYEPAFANMQETLQTALAHDVWGVVGVGCDVDTNERTLALATANSKMVWACLGFHPDRVHLSDHDLEQVEQQVIEHHARIIGLGEVGLPWYCLQSSSDPAAPRPARCKPSSAMASSARSSTGTRLRPTSPATSWGRGTSCRWGRRSSTESVIASWRRRCRSTPC